MDKRYDKVVPRVVSFLQWLFFQSSVGSKSQFSHGNIDDLDFLQPAHCAHADNVISGFNMNYRNAVAFSTIPNDVNPYDIGYQRNVRCFVKCKL